MDMMCLGALQVDEKGNLASHSSGKMVLGMGAMDLTGAPKTKVAHSAMNSILQDGSPKILKSITFRLQP